MAVSAIDDSGSSEAAGAEAVTSLLGKLNFKSLVAKKTKEKAAA